MNAIPQRLNAMTHEQKARRIMELENALQQTNDRIAQAVRAEREACAREAEAWRMGTTMRDVTLCEAHGKQIAAAIRARNGAK